MRTVAVIEGGDAALGTLYRRLCRGSFRGFRVLAAEDLPGARRAGADVVIVPAATLGDSRRRFPFAVVAYVGSGGPAATRAALLAGAAEVLAAPDLRTATVRATLERALARPRAFARRRRSDDSQMRWLERLLGAQDGERARIAREIHDDASQGLTVLLLGLRSLEQARSLGETRAAAHMLRETVAQTMEALERISRGLHPAALALGLGRALEKLVQEQARVAAFAPEIATEGLEGLPAPLALHVFRIVQEAVTNAARHSRAHHLRVLAAVEGGRLTVVVEDDGIGFGPAADVGVRLGLRGIRERAAILGGHADIRSAPGEGTRVSVEVPLATAVPS